MSLLFRRASSFFKQAVYFCDKISERQSEDKCDVRYLGLTWASLLFALQLVDAIEHAGIEGRPIIIPPLGSVSGAARL